MAEKNTETKAVDRYSGKYVVFQEGDFFYKYRLKASNGQPLIVSEAYRKEKACFEGIETLKKNVESLQVDFEKDKHAKWCFRLITKQGRPLAQSANYDTFALAKKASESYKKFVNTPVVEKDDVESSHFKVELFAEQVAKKEKGKYTIDKDTDGDFSYSLVASNGRILCSSQAYKSVESCKAAMENFRSTVYDGEFYIFIDKRGNAFFKLYSKQLRLVMTGEVYATKALAKAAVESIIAFAAGGKLQAK